METVAARAESRAWRSVAALWPYDHHGELDRLRLWGERMVEIRIDTEDKKRIAESRNAQDVYETIRTVLSKKHLVPSCLILITAIERWGATLIALRRCQTPVERQAALDEAKRPYEMQTS